MTTETTPKKSAKSQAKGNELHLTALEGETDKESIARSLFNTPMQATITINNYLEKHFDAGLTELGVALQRQVAQVNIRRHEERRGTVDRPSVYTGRGLSSAGKAGTVSGEHGLL